MLPTATQTATPVKTEAKKAATSAATKDDKAPSTSAASVAAKDDKAPSTSAAPADAPADAPAKKKTRQRVYIVVGAVHEFTNTATAEKFLNQDPSAPMDSTTYQVIKGKMVQGKAKVSLR